MLDSVRFYSAEQVHSALPYGALADAIADAFRAGVSDERRADPSSSRAPAGGGRAATGGERIIAPLRHAHAMSATDSLLLMPAWNSEAIGVKLVSVQPENSRHGRATVNALYALFDRATGEPRAVIDGEALTLRRTAAASLLAARYLARDDASAILIVGTGRLALHLAHAHCSERNVERVTIWGRSEERARALAAALRGQRVPAEMAANLGHAVAGAHIVSCATTATAPVVQGGWLQPGTHLDLVGAFRRGMREVDDAAVARSCAYVDTRAGAMAEADDIIEPIEHGVVKREHVVGELSDLVTRRVAGRGTSEQITLFKSVGTAIEDLAAAQLLLKSTR